MKRILSLVVVVLALVPSAAWSGGNDDCLQCHGERGLTMTKKGKTVELYVEKSGFHASAHGEMECVSCHEGFSASDIPHARKIVPVKCSTCHTEEQFLRFSESLHGSTKKGGAAITCSGCHGTHDIAKLSSESPAQRQQFAVAACAKCHEQVNTRYQASDHALALAAGVKGAPSCIDCHNVHDIQRPGSDSASTSRAHEAAMCLACHVDNPDVRARVGPSAGFISSYEKSVHGKAMHDGMTAAATCTDCHGSHDMKKGANPASRVAKKNIASTCGGCHADILEQYKGSIHGTKLASGVEASATCTDCHGEHDILSPKDAASRVSAKNVSGQVCSPCHASVRLTKKFGLASDRYKSFEDSYHGLAGKAGSVEVANCASCHGVHDIKPSSDSTSRISPRNLVKTCGACHPGANTNFTRGSVHVVVTDKNEGILYLVSSGYIILIIVVIGGMAFHNIADFVTKSRRRLMERRGIIIRHHPGHRLYLRMSLGERFQHGTLLVSFLTLVVTGFALRFPDAWWVAPVRDLSPWMFFARGIVHRIAGVVLVVVSLYHIYYLFFVPRGKQLLKDLLPVRRDVADAIGMLKYNLSLSSERPKLDRFSYIEKAEYWALIWGTAVMAGTGAILWFDNTFLGILTKLWWDVARTVHYYEAWLATLAIVVWHFYFVMFNPDIYPINLAFWKGTLTEEEMEEEHPAELERLKKQRAAEAHEE
jgi:cytochrome b subunit of formate dehydrogenase